MSPITAADKPISEPTEISISPVTMTSITPQATIATGAQTDQDIPQVAQLDESDIDHTDGQANRQNEDGESVFTPRQYVDDELFETLHAFSDCFLRPGGPTS